MTQTAPEELVAVDVHTHVLASTYRAGPEDPALKSLASVSGFDHLPTLPEMIDYYRARNMAFVTFTVDDVSRTGVEPPVGNLEILDLAGKYPDVVIPFASVDPNRGTAAVRLATELLDEHGARGLKFHPSQQQFYPNDRAHYPLYELLAERGLPALFHTGTTGVGRGQPGGGGIRLKYSNPMYLDDVAADFNELPIIMAHPSFPWQEEALAVATHKPQVYIDLSGWSPKYFPPVLVQHIKTLLKDRVLFGSDFPLITPDRWIQDFDTLGVTPEVRSLVLKENAMRLLDLSDLLEARRVRQAEDALSDGAGSISSGPAVIVDCDDRAPGRANHLSFWQCAPVAGSHRHRMDHRRALWSVRNDQPRRFAARSGAKDEVANGVIGHLLNHQRVRHRVLNVRATEPPARREGGRPA